MAVCEQYNVRLSAKARADLGKIISYLAINSVESARKVKTEIVASIKLLKDFPESFPFLEGDFIPYNKYRKMVVMKRYLVIYQIQENNVFVEYVVDGRQDYQWLIR